MGEEELEQKQHSMKDMVMIGNLARYLKPYLPKFIFAIVLIHSQFCYTRQSRYSIKKYCDFLELKQLNLHLY